MHLPPHLSPAGASFLASSYLVSRDPELLSLRSSASLFLHSAAQPVLSADPFSTFSTGLFAILPGPSSRNAALALLRVTHLVAVVQVSLPLTRTWCTWCPLYPSSICMLCFPGWLRCVALCPHRRAVLGSVI